MSRNDRDRLKVLHEVRKRHITHKYKRGRVGHQSALGTGVVAADESTGRPGGARVAGEGVEPATAGGHEGAGGEAVSSLPVADSNLPPRRAADF